MSENQNATAVAIHKPQTQAVSLFSSIEGFEAGQRMAGALAKSSLVPKEYQNNVANTLIALEYANRLGESPFVIMQNVHVINGKPGLKSEYLISRINQSGRFGSSLKFKYEGEEGSKNRSCKAYVIERDGQTLEGTRVTMEMADKEGWLNRSGSKWKSFPDQMLAYRAAAFFQRLHAPDLAMGIQTTEEVIDIAYEEVKPSAPSIDAVNERIKNNKKSNSAPVINMQPEAKKTDNENVIDAEIVSETPVTNDII